MPGTPAGSSQLDGAIRVGRRCGGPRRAPRAEPGHGPTRQTVRSPARRVRRSGGRCCVTCPGAPPGCLGEDRAGGEGEASPRPAGPSNGLAGRVRPPRGRRAYRPGVPFSRRLKYSSRPARNSSGSEGPDSPEACEMPRSSRTSFSLTPPPIRASAESSVLPVPPPPGRRAPAAAALGVDPLGHAAAARWPRSRRRWPGCRSRAGRGSRPPRP